MIENLKEKILNIFYPEVVIQLNQFESLKDANNHLNSIIQTQDLKKQELINIVKEFTEQDSSLTEIEMYCQKAFKEVPKFAYNDKRRYLGIKYAVYPNELIQPDKFIVDKARKEIGTLPPNCLQKAEVIGRYVDRMLHWTSDQDSTGMPDYYHSPVESLVSKKVDCDSHSLLVASLQPTFFGVAFGNTERNNKGTWHAWNVFLHNDELYCLETNSVANFSNGGNTRVFKYSTGSYRINWIFTKNKTFEVDRTIHFGIIAK